MNSDIKKMAENLNDEVIFLRREIHKRAELSFCEYKTSEFVLNYLKDLDVTVKSGIAKTGVVAFLNAGKEETILFRADMDALPVTEPEDREYRSETEGVMHACGHDNHVAILLATAKLLCSIKNELPVNVLFVFQPGEETTGGAEPMIAEGILEEFGVTKACALHVANDVPCGKISVKYGNVNAAPDDFDLTIKGRGGHGAYPHKCIDPIAISAHVLSGFETIASRNVSPFSERVISICSIHAGTTANIIPDDVLIRGTVRTYDEELRRKMPVDIEKMIKGICEGFGAGYELKYNFRYPPTINDDNMVDSLITSAKKILGDDSILTSEASMGGDDFAYFSQKVPGVYFNLGSGNEKKGLTEPLHSSTFDVDEDCLKVGISVLASFVLNQ